MQMKKTKALVQKRLKQTREALALVQAQITEMDKRLGELFLQDFNRARGSRKGPFLFPFLK
jgi:hypothetical protein